jgi:hypothetical protein
VQGEIFADVGNIGKREKKRERGGGK